MIHNIIYSITVVLLSIIMFFVSRKYWFFYKKAEYVKSSVDDKYYLVRNTDNKQMAADTLATINKRIKFLVDNLDENTSPQEVKHNIELLKKRDIVLAENIYMEDTSFTVNKLEMMICLTPRDSDAQNVYDTRDIYDINKLMFVALHELAHVGCKSYGHGKEFVMLFIYLLKKGIDLDVYDYVNYHKEPEEYCGIILNTTPV